MMRTRLLWFTSGFVVAGTSIAYFLHRDLSGDRHALLSQFKDNFGALETRASNLESLSCTSGVPQDGAKSSSDGSVGRSFAA